MDTGSHFPCLFAGPHYLLHPWAQICACGSARGHFGRHVEHLGQIIHEGSSVLLINSFCCQYMNYVNIYPYLLRDFTYILFSFFMFCSCLLCAFYLFVLVQFTTSVLLFDLEEVKPCYETRHCISRLAFSITSTDLLPSQPFGSFISIALEF